MHRFITRMPSPALHAPPSALQSLEQDAVAHPTTSTSQHPWPPPPREPSRQNGSNVAKPAWPHQARKPASAYSLRSTFPTEIAGYLPSPSHTWMLLPEKAAKRATCTASSWAGSPASAAAAYAEYPPPSRSSRSKSSALGAELGMAACTVVEKLPGLGVELGMGCDGALQGLGSASLCAAAV